MRAALLGSLIFATTSVASAPPDPLPTLPNVCAAIAHFEIKREVRKDYEVFLGDALATVIRSLSRRRELVAGDVDSATVRVISESRRGIPELMALGECFSEGEPRGFAQVYWTHVALSLSRPLTRTLTNILGEPKAFHTLLPGARDSVDQRVQAFQRAWREARATSPLKLISALPLSDVLSVDDARRVGARLRADSKVPEYFQEDLLFCEQASGSIGLAEPIYGFQHLVQAVLSAREALP